MDASLKRTSRGRQKIQMKKIENESNLQVTFSKRRSGLFKKASELCTLCGVQMCLIIFSPSDKPYSFGNPNVETLIERFLKVSPEALPMDPVQCVVDAQRAFRMRSLNTRLNEINDMLEAVKKNADEWNRNMKDPKAHKHWLAGPLDEMNVPQLKLLKFSMEELQKTVIHLISEKIHLQTAIHIFDASAPALAPTPAAYSATATPFMFYANSSSSSSVVAATTDGGNYMPQSMWSHQQNTTTLVQNNEQRHNDDGNINLVNQVYYGGYTSMLVGGGYGPYGGPIGFY